MFKVIVRMQPVGDAVITYMHDTVPEFTDKMKNTPGQCVFEYIENLQELGYIGIIDEMEFWGNDTYIKGILDKHFAMRSGFAYRDIPMKIEKDEYHYVEEEEGEVNG